MRKEECFRNFFQIYKNFCSNVNFFYYFNARKDVRKRPLVLLYLKKRLAKDCL